MGHCGSDIVDAWRWPAFRQQAASLARPGRCNNDVSKDQYNRKYIPAETLSHDARLYSRFQPGIRLAADYPAAAVTRGRQSHPRLPDRRVQAAGLG